MFPLYIRCQRGLILRRSGLFSQRRSSSLDETKFGVLGIDQQQLW